ncbi:MAG: penicillin-binding protein activator [Pseudomonadota bacterium]
MTRAAASLAGILRYGGLCLAALILGACAQTAGTSTATGGAIRSAPQPDTAVSFDPNGRVQVALLAPTGSSNENWEAIGQSVARAARLAVDDLTGAEIDLRIYPTQVTAAGTAAATQRAISEGAKLIVGPVRSAMVGAASPAAAAAGIPILTLSNNTAIAGNGVYTVGLTFEDSARRVMGYASRRGIRRIGVVHSNDAAGNAGRAAASKTGAPAGATIVTSAGYERSTSGISSAAPGFVASMKGAAVDGVLMTDTGSGLIFASSFLPYYGLDTDVVKIMGLQDLGTPQVQAERALRGAWYAAPDPELEAIFSERYAARYGTEPHQLAGIAYDALAAAGALLREARASGDRSAFSARNLTAPQGFAGVNGPFKFLSDGTVERGLAVMEVTENGPRVLDPAPGRFTFTGS